MTEKSFLIAQRHSSGGHGSKKRLSRARRKVLMYSLARQWQFYGSMYVKRLQVEHLKYANQLTVNGNRSSVLSHKLFRH